MANAASNPVLPNTATINSVALPSCTGLSVNISSTEIQFPDEAGGPIDNVKAIDGIGTWSIDTFDPEGVFVNTIVPGVSGSMIVLHTDLVGGAAITCTAAGAVVTGASGNTSHGGPGTATVSGSATFGSSGENAFQWT